MAVSAQVQHVSQSDWQTAVLGSQLPVLVDFFATWCGPCRYVAPIVEQLAGELAGKVRFVKLDIDESPDIAVKYAIEGVPTLVLFKGGQEADRVVGAAPKQALRSWLDERIA